MKFLSVATADDLEEQLQRDTGLSLKQIKDSAKHKHCLSWDPDYNKFRMTQAVGIAIKGDPVSQIRDEVIRSQKGLVHKPLFQAPHILTTEEILDGFAKGERGLAEFYPPHILGSQGILEIVKSSHPAKWEFLIEPKKNSDQNYLPGKLRIIIDQELGQLLIKDLASVEHWEISAIIRFISNCQGCSWPGFKGEIYQALKDRGEDNTPATDFMMKLALKNLSNA